MNPQKVAAQFAAYVWSLDGQHQPPEEAARFARESWPAFLPIAHAGLGRLLIRVAGIDGDEESRDASRLTAKRRPRRSCALAGSAGGRGSW